MRIRWVLLTVLFCAACGDDGGTTPPVDSKTIDSPAGATCTGAAYDPCTMATQCMSNNCKLFMADGIQVCTTACTPGDNNTCPLDKNGTHGTCNNMAICKPAVANSCTR